VGKEKKSSTLSLTSSLDEGGWSRLGGPHGRYGSVRKISFPTGIRSPDRPSRSKSLYRRRYPQIYMLLYIPCDADYKTNSRYAGNVHKNVINQTSFLFTIIHSSFLHWVFPYSDTAFCSYFVCGRTSFIPICDSKTSRENEGNAFLN